MPEILGIGGNGLAFPTNTCRKERDKLDKKVLALLEEWTEVLRARSSFELRGLREDAIGSWFKKSGRYALPPNSLRLSDSYVV